MHLKKNGEKNKCDTDAVEVLSVRKTEGGQNEYYVHYTEFNRRLDEWVTLDHLSAPRAETRKGRHRGEEARTTRNSKRKGPAKGTEEDAPPGGHLSVLEREHEEITKVKNIHTIELGVFEIDTWYFSP